MNNMFYETCKVGVHTLTLTVDFDGEVSVKVNGQYTDQELPPRVGAVLIKKGRKLFEDFAELHPEIELCCSAYNGDGKAEYREKIFKWCGFHPVPEHSSWKLVYKG